MGCRSPPLYQFKFKKFELIGGYGMANMPKRRKYKDNPYTLNYINEKNIYMISFKDSRGVNQNVEVDKNVFMNFNEFELHDIKELNEYDRHIEHSEIYDFSLEKKLKNRSITLEEEVIKKMSFYELRRAIELLPKIQKRRIKKYYFDNKSEQEIAREEKTTQQSVHIILNRALQNLKKILKNKI